MAVVVTIKDSETPSKTVGLASPTLARLMVDGALFEKGIKYTVEVAYADKLLAMLDDQRSKYFKEVDIEDAPVVTAPEEPKTVKVKTPKAPKADDTKKAAESTEAPLEGAEDAPVVTTPPASSKIEEV